MTNTLTNRRVILSSRPKGVPQPEHFTVEDIAVPDLTDGQFLIKMHYWSIDPAMRGWANELPNYLPPVAIGAAMRAFAVGEIVESRHDDYQVGEVITGKFGWNSYAISDGSDVDRRVTETDLPTSLSVGVLGLNGITAYLGLLDVCDPQPGDTVVVSTAAGAVGSAVGQIARIKGARTIGITSSPEKMALCRDQFGYDEVISYRDDGLAGGLAGAIRAAAPDGVNCYFDNTCGPISDAVFTNLALGARICICGTASLTDWDPIPVGPRVHRQLLVARARLQGFLVLDHQARFGEAVAQLADWVRSGELTYQEHVLDGADAAPGAIDLLYQGGNKGKLLVSV